MKKIVLSVFFFMSIFFNSFAHSDPDRIVGTYLATSEGARLDHGNRYVGALAETGMKSGCPSDMKNL